MTFPDKPNQHQFTTVYFDTKGQQIWPAPERAALYAVGTACLRCGAINSQQPCRP